MCIRHTSFKQDIKDIFKGIADVSLLGQNMQFLIMCLANFFVFMGYFLTFIYLNARADQIGSNKGAWLLSIIGKIYKVEIRYESK